MVIENNTNTFSYLLDLKTKFQINSSECRIKRIIPPPFLTIRTLQFLDHGYFDNEIFSLFKNPIAKAHQYANIALLLGNDHIFAHIIVRNHNLLIDQFEISSERVNHEFLMKKVFKGIITDALNIGFAKIEGDFQLQQDQPREYLCSALEGWLIKQIEPNIVMEFPKKKKAVP